MAGILVVILNGQLGGQDKKLQYVSTFIAFNKHKICKEKHSDTTCTNHSPKSAMSIFIVIL
jgi:hypothetical protein